MFSSKMICAMVLAVALAGFARVEAEVVIAAPSGLTAGQGFRVMVVTSAKTRATSTDINFYNNFVANDTAATNYTYGGNAVTFKAWGSTSTVAAKANIGWVAANQEGVYRADATLISTSALFLTQNHAAQVSTGPEVFVWTGAEEHGGSRPGFSLGDVADGVILYGISGDYWTTGNWSYGGGGGVDQSRVMYGISDVLTVAAVPEPGTMILGSIAAACGGGGVWWRRRRGGKNQSAAEISEEVVA